MPAIKVINIMAYPPPYEEYANQPRPSIHWDIPGGNWVGIWGFDWADLIGTAILEISDQVEYQVWQPDYRADKVYSHTFANQMKHCLFPAIKIANEPMSQSMIASLNEISAAVPTIIMLPPPDYRLASTLLRNLKIAVNTRIICAWAGEISFPINQLFRLRKRITQYVLLLLKQHEVKKTFSQVDGVVYINNKNISYLRRYFNGPSALIPMGIDFTFWRAGCKLAARKKLNLPEHKKVILSSSRLVDLKQIDKLIDSLKKLGKGQEYLMVITGHGTRLYEKYLKEKAGELIQFEKLVFTGYVSDEKLLLYYQAADLFVLTSSSEGSPVNVQKALACELPVMTTAVGFTAEVLQNNHAGVILPVKKYKQWTVELKKFLAGSEIPVLDRKIAEEIFSWRNIAEKYLSFYDKILNICQKEQS